ncbi:type VII secretion target [Nocardia mexicana]|uniref:Uncharacterized protein YukE n=1 Tax=Nocardia mexicana TaxID=279262 RepID=A0A370HDL2_9NOCA|nr:type VII secretion target [Nocardia mexicana]RDI55321.1 uncharacterized protein YukE [Nocardia mexicana]
MSKKPIEVEPDGLRRSANEFDEVADRAEKLLETLQAASAGQGEPWGGDKIGEKFADGEKGFKSNRDNTFASLGKIVDVFHDNAKNLRDTARIYEENERKLSDGKQPLHSARPRSDDHQYGSLNPARQDVPTGWTPARYQPADALTPARHDVVSGATPVKSQPPDTISPARQDTPTGWAPANSRPADALTPARHDVPTGSGPTGSQPAGTTPPTGTAPPDPYSAPPGPRSADATLPATHPMNTEGTTNNPALTPHTPSHHVDAVPATLPAAHPVNTEGTVESPTPTPHNVGSTSPHLDPAQATVPASHAMNTEGAVDNPVSRDAGSTSQVQPHSAGFPRAQAPRDPR